MRAFLVVSIETDSLVLVFLWVWLLDVELVASGLVRVALGFDGCNRFGCAIM